MITVVYNVEIVEPQIVRRPVNRVKSCLGAAILRVAGDDVASQKNA